MKRFEYYKNKVKHPIFKPFLPLSILKNISLGELYLILVIYIEETKR